MDLSQYWKVLLRFHQQATPKLTQLFLFWLIRKMAVCLVAVRLCTLADCELNCVSGCGEVMYCWRAVSWTVCLVAVRLCTAGGLWTELCVWLQWGYVLLACCELNCVSGCSEVMYCWWIVNWTVCLVAVSLCTVGGFWKELCSDTADLNWREN